MRKLSLLLGAIFVLIFTACSKDEEETTVEEKPAPKEEEVTYFPFTGLETTEEVTNRAVAVMINNHHQARPHLGLSEADIVFELLAEGDITRFLAIFHSEQPAMVGSVRSAREYYFELAAGYDALYVYHGAAKFVNEMIRSRNIEHLDGALFDNDGHLFKRESFRRAPHNSFLLFDAVYEEASKKGYDTERTYESLPFLKEGEVIEGSDSGKYVAINYATNGQQLVEYEYDESTEKYYRKHNNEQTVELHSEDLVELSNVFIIETYHEIIDNEGRRNIDMTSGGKGYLLQKGQLQQVEWVSENGRILPVKDGTTVGFVPGKTWVNVVPTDPGLEQSVTFE